MNMKSHAKLIAALGASAVAGAVVAALVVATAFSAASHSAIGAGHGHGDATPLFGGASGSSQSTFYLEMTEVNAHMHAAMETVPSGDIDQDFTRMMIPHHQGAIDMALVLMKYGHDERLRRLAQSIVVEQGQEIAYMRTLQHTPQAEQITSHPSSDK
jgi:uncharacterized protein (DUF305 family)